MNTIHYKRLPGRIMGFVSTPSAWLAEDHILIIGGSRFTETYQRIDLKDIRALIIRKKSRFIFHWPYLLLIPGLVILISSTISAPGSVFLTIFLTSVVFLAAAFGWAQFGCILDLATAVGNVTVRSVASRGTARRFSAKLGPAIQAAQQKQQGPE